MSLPDTGRAERAGAVVPVLRTIQICLGALALMAPALMAGRPTGYGDVVAYYRIGEHAVSTASRLFAALLHLQSTSAAAAAAGVAGSVHGGTLSAIGAARSGFYSVYLFATCSLSPWVLVALNALLVSTVINVFCNAVAPGPRGWGFAVVIAAAIAFSSLAFYVCFLGPDIYMFTAVLALALVTILGARLGPIERIVCWSLLAMSLCFHITIPAVVLVLAVAGWVAAWRIRAAPSGLGSAFAVSFAAAIIALATLELYPKLESRISGEPVSWPPFMTARLLADGPGRDFLRDGCVRHSAFAICNYRGKRLDDSEDILWSGRPEVSVFMAASPATRARLSAEDSKFAMAVASTRPLAVAGSAVHNVERLATRVSVNAVVGWPIELEDNTSAVQADGPFCARANISDVKEDLSCPVSRTEAVWEALIRVGLVVSLIVLIGVLVTAAANRRLGFEPPEWAASFSVLVLGAVALNDVICAVLSVPTERYSMRLTPILVVAAVATVQASLARSQDRRSAQWTWVETPRA